MTPNERKREPYRSLAAAIVEQAIADAALWGTWDADFFRGPHFPILLEMAGVKVPADVCRRALRERLKYIRGPAAAVTVGPMDEPEADGAAGEADDSPLTPAA